MSLCAVPLIWLKCCLSDWPYKLAYVAEQEAELKEADKTRVKKAY
jgi:hypothetical protein